MPNLMHNWLEFNGQKSTDLGLTVERIPNSNRPARKYDRYSVPGRNGDIFVFQDAWENIEQSYEICWKGTPVDTGYNIAEWLFGSSGYQMLTDSYDPLHYRKAVFLGPYDVENTLMRYGRATITFDCDPRRFLMSGLEPVEFSSDVPLFELTNPTPFIAKPTIDIQIGPTDDDAEIYIGSQSAAYGATTLKLLASSYNNHVVIYSEDEAACWGGTAVRVRWNGEVSGKFPLIFPGANNVEIDPGSNGYGTIIPNWWTL